ncbi:MAG: hypothetical protein KZQ70_10605 [gamma proteobacterium symbiont of Lucinoma myriamae]|nr:hypothetical protein [gamma proteobacterium symbiont of Lucinoma myriamae]MCU7819622.1 hypothetical protein [gamma proteobacterium symbiont of Lucinoma myriamae]
MPRPEIEIEKYQTAMKKMLSEGLRIDEITASKVQKIVGGQFPRIRGIVSDFKEEHFERQGIEKTSPQASWFKDLVSSITESTANQLNETWITINTEISSSVALASESFEQKKAELEEKAQEDLEQIKTLENKNEQLLLEYEQTKDEIEKLKNQVNLLSAETKNKDQDLKEFKSDIKDLQSNNLDLNKALSLIEGQIIEKDKVIAKYEAKQ